MSPPPPRLSSSVRRFLESTSIHGLRYTAESELPRPIRLLWLFCVAVGFVSAGCIVVKHLRQWKNNPSVIAGVSTVLVQGKKWHPRVTVCPIGLDTDRLAFSLAERFPNGISDEVLFSLKLRLTRSLVAGRQERRRGDFTTAIRVSQRVQQFMDPCRTEVEEAWPKERSNRTAATFPDLPKLSDPCELLRSLWALLITHVGEDKYRWSKLGSTITRFLSEVSLGIDVATADTFEGHANAWLKTRKNFSEMRAESDSTFPPPFTPNYNMFNPFLPDATVSFYSMTHYERLLFLYSYFHPVIDGARDVLPLRGLSKFHGSAVNLEQAELGKFLKAVVAGGFNGLDETDKQDLLKDGMTSLLGEPPDLKASAWSHSNYLMMTLGSFTTQLALGYYCQSGWCQYPCQHQFSNATTRHLRFKTVCEEAREDGDSDCAEYCRMARLNTTWIDKVAWALEEASGDANHPDDQLPGCYLRRSGKVEGDCWTRVVNEKGVCFTTDKFVNVVIRRGGLSESLIFALDMGQTLSVYSASGRYSVAFTQWNEFTPSRYSPADKVETMLMPTSEKNFPTDEDESRVAHVTVKVLRHSTTTPDFATVPPDTRRCYYPDEKALKHFPSYSESNCLLECAWAAGAKVAGCVPWYLRGTQYEVNEMCEKHGLRIFNGLVAERNEMDDECTTGCLQDCERVEYQIETKTLNHRVSKQARDDLAIVNGLVDGGRRNGTQLGLSPAKAELLEELTEAGQRKLAVVKVLMSMDVALEIVSTAATTPLDAVASIGGTLGLFSGFSIISGVEVLFWVGRCLGCQRRKKHKRGELKRTVVA